MATVRTCLFRGCKNTSLNCMRKIFIRVPKNREVRKLWFQSARGDRWEVTNTSDVFCCEDHFDLENDCENWQYFKTVGTRMVIKKGIVPRHLERSSNEESQFSKSDEKRKSEILTVVKSKMDSSAAERSPERGPRRKLFVPGEAGASISIAFQDPEARREPFGESTFMSAVGSGQAGSFQCPHCPVEFPWNFQLKKHIQTSHTDTDIFHIFDCSMEPEMHRCKQCLPFCDHLKVELHAHMTEAHPVQRSRKRKRSYRKRLNRWRKFYQSGHWDFTTQSCLVIVKHHFLMSKSSMATRRRLACQVCQQFEMTFVLGQRFSTGEVWFKCSTCSYRSSIKASLKRHIQSRHAYPERSAWFECTACSYRSRLRSLLKKHMLWRHSDAEWLGCSECSFRTKMHGEFAKHRHDLVAWYNCPRCSFYCRHSDALSKHVALMHPPRDLQWCCLKCCYETLDEVELKRHMIDEHCERTKTDWFACDQCPYSTAREGNFKRHIESHRLRQAKIKALFNYAPGGVSQISQVGSSSPRILEAKAIKPLLKQTGCSVVQRVLYGFK